MSAFASGFDYSFVWGCGVICWLAEAFKLLQTFIFLTQVFMLIVVFLDLLMKSIFQKENIRN